MCYSCLLSRTTYLLTPWCRVLIEKLTGLQLVNILCILLNPKFHCRTHKPPPPVTILGQPNPVHIPTSHLLEIHPNIIHPSTPRSPQCSLSLRFPHQNPIHPLYSPIHTTCPAHLILLNFITRTILGESTDHFAPRYAVSSIPPLPRPSMFSDTLSFHSSLNVSDQVSHPYKTTGKIIVLYILSFKFLDSNLEDKRFYTEVQNTLACEILHHSFSVKG